ncbi:MAG: ankyrin repeat domain-containing protein [Oceanospirillaceae bacterium]|nr:ankyrin repeat domain-containing protein [Oceanospirillaceae bacterium]
MKRLFSFRKTKSIDTNELKQALYHSDLATIKKVVQNGFDVNSQIESFQSDPILMKAILCSSEMKGTNRQLEVIEYLLDHGADVNVHNADGYNSLHLTLAHHDLSGVSLLLILKGQPDVNLAESKHGNTPLFIAIREYGLTWREDQKEVNRLRYQIIEELLKRGAQIDKANNHGVTPRFWTERLTEDDPVHSLIK